VVSFFENFVRQPSQRARRLGMKVSKHILHPNEGSIEPFALEFEEKSNRRIRARSCAQHRHAKIFAI
jgi:hypothetical protein